MSQSDGLDCTVLVVDDDQHLRELFVMVLENNGYQVVPAENVTQARALLVDRRFSLVITDYEMPEFTGAQLIEEIRTRYPETRTLLMSAHHSLPQLAEQAGADRYFQKNGELDTLLAHVRTLTGDICT